MRKLRRKRKLSTELHSRWGDVSITYPTEGSWSQWNQPAGFVASTANPSSSPEECYRHESFGSHDTASYVPRTLHPDTNGDKAFEDAAMTIPTGHFDAGLRYRTENHSPSYDGYHRHHHHTEGNKYNPRTFTPSPAEHSDSEDDNHRNSPPQPSNHWHQGRDPVQTNNRTHKVRAETATETETSSDRERASKSPPLSVTSRMRRQSQQSNSNSTSTEPPSSSLSMPNTASSLNTSFAPSSVCPEDLRSAYDHNNSHSDMATTTAITANIYPGKLPLGKYHEPDTLTGQQLVPSYDELYG